MRLPRALGQRGRQKYNSVVQKVTNVHQKKKNEHDVSERNTRLRSEKTEVRQCFSFAAKMV